MSKVRRLFLAGVWFWLVWVSVLPYMHRHPHCAAPEDTVLKDLNGPEHVICTACWWSHNLAVDGSSIQESLLPVGDARFVPRPVAFQILIALNAVSRAPPA